MKDLLVLIGKSSISPSLLDNLGLQLLVYCYINLINEKLTSAERNGFQTRLLLFHMDKLITKVVTILQFMFNLLN